MFKKLIVLVLLANLGLGVNNAYALTCKDDNKVSMNPDTEVCCCKKTTETDINETYECKPMENTNNGKCPGKEVAEGDANYKTKISTKTNDTCICKLTKNKK